MTVVTYTEARNNFKSILDRVAEDADYTVISRQDAEDAVVMSLEYFNAFKRHCICSPRLQTSSIWSASLPSIAKERLKVTS